MRRRRGVSPTAHSFLPWQKRHSAPFSLRGKEKAAGGKKKTAKGEFRISPFANPLKTTKKGAAAPFLGFSPGLGLCGICFQIVQTRDGCVFDRPAWQSKYSAIVSNVPCVEVRLCAICSAALAGRTAFRLPYVKYSTGADRTTCMAYRAIGKPDSTACVTTKRRTERRAFQARQRYLASSGLFFHIFSAKTEKIWPAERR